MSCCKDDHCNVALMNDMNCYHIACISNDYCLPIRSANVEAKNHVRLVLINPVSNDETWWDVLNQSFENQNKEQINVEMLKHFLNADRYIDDNILNEMLMNEKQFDNEYEFKTSSSHPLKECEVDIDHQCPLNEECVQLLRKSRSGICRCKEGFIRNQAGHCIFESVGDDFINPRLTDKILPVNTTNTSNKKQLTVSVQSKEVNEIIILYFVCYNKNFQVRLPENDVTLAAYVVPVASPGEKYQYEWILLKQPPGNPIKDQNEGLLRLSKLSQGLYTFKVSILYLPPISI